MMKNEHPDSTGIDQSPDLRGNDHQYGEQMNNKSRIEFGVVIISTCTNEITIAFSMPESKEDSQVKLTQCDEMLLYDFIHCFRFKPVQKNNTHVLTLENPVVFDETLKNNIIAFIAKYSCIAPSLNAIPAKLSRIPLGKPIIIADLKVRNNQQLMFEMLNRLSVLQGMSALTPDFFEFLGKYEYSSVGHNPHTQIGHKRKSDRICRWCGKTMVDNATFSKKGHAISESLGNKNVVLCDECDVCNEMFGETIEDVAATYFSFENTICGIHGKNGIPKVKNAQCESIENTGDSCISIATTTFEANGDRPPAQVMIKAAKKIIEQDVYRCFCKYALSCCKDDIFVQFKYLIPWIKKEFDYDKTPWVLAYRNPNIDVDTGDLMEQPIMNMYIRRDNDNSMPYFICELHHASALTCSSSQEMITKGLSFHLVRLVLHCGVSCHLSKKKRGKIFMICQKQPRTITCAL